MELFLGFSPSSSQTRELLTQSFEAGLALLVAPCISCFCLVELSFTLVDLLGNSIKP
jgi:hypothetical protein